MTNLKLLIVEDEMMIGMGLKTMLSRAGYTVVGLVATGEEAIQLARDEEPDIVIMDIRLMGTINGIEAAAEIGKFSSPRIIFTTGYQDSALKERALALSPLAYLLKPADWRKIDETIRSGL